MFSSRKSAAPAAAGGYTIAKSLRFRSSASAYLNRTPASASNQQKWTWSGWVKRGLINASFQRLFSAKDASNDDADCLRFNSGETFTFFFRTTPNLAITGNLTTTQVFRDPSAWYHIVAVLDTTDATSSNRMKLYINGSQVTAFSTATYPAQNASGYINSTNLHTIGNNAASLAQNFDGYMAEVNFIDGQALTPTSFGATNAATGVWQPIAYTGTYGTNGFYLKFTNTTSTSTLGNDSSGNNNTWTVNNISLTSGATYDSMTDVPTNTSATVANYCVLNPLVTPATTTIINGNLGMSGYTPYSSVTGTMGVTSGKWYFEFIAQANAMSGITGTPNGSFYPGQASNAYAWDSSNAAKYSNNSSAPYGSATSAGDIVGVAFDLDSGSITFYKNNVSQGTAYTFTPSGTYFPVVRNSDTTNTSINFGQRPFSYTPPSGFVALNTFNLPTPTIGATSTTQAGKYFNPVLYTGNASGASVTGVGFQPDFVWMKCRSTARNHELLNAVTGGSSTLFSNLTNAEATDQRISSFNSDGFTYTTNSNSANTGDTYVAWNWKANGAGSSNTAGTITSTVSANTTAGFSIVTYTGTGSNATVGHGLGVAPKMVIVKCRNTAGENWQVYNSNLTSAAYRLRLNTTDAEDSVPTMWNSTAPTSSVFSVGTQSGVNGNTQTYVAYCFAQVAGYSAFGSYTGNGSTDGVFIYTGFRPRYLMVKTTSNAGYNWNVHDTARNPYNSANLVLYPNTSGGDDAYSAGSGLDILSNGFKIRDAGGGLNGSGFTYIYMAFAESPFKYANAR